MMRMNKKRILRIALLLICSVTIASVETSVYAEPSTEDLEQKTSNLQGELNNLNSELASLGQELDNTSTKIETMAAEVEKTKLDLAAAELNEEAQYEAMRDRIKFMYEGGNVSLLQILFSSENMADFLNKAEYVTVISDYDRDMLAQFQAISEEVEKKQKELETQQSELAAMQADLTKKQENLQSRIASASGSLSDYSAQLDRAKAAAAALATAQNNKVSGTLPSGNTSGNSSGGSSGNASGGTVNTGSSTPADVSDVALLAAILQCEAGSSYDGMIAVGTVIMNRVASPRFPNSINGVIYQSGQFSPTWTGKLNKVLASGASSSACSAAQAVLGGTRHSSVISCLYFNAAWTGKPGVNVGGNIFW